jgi:hypothetical protein
MFKKPIVFVLGAGSSFEVGLPLGVALRNTIAESVNFHVRGRMRIRGDEELFRRLSQHLDPNKNDPVRLTKYVVGGQELAATMPRFPSVDEALHYLSDNKEVVELGKIAITQELLRSERRSVLFDKAGAQGAAVNAADATWLAPFVGMALSGLKREEVASAFQHVTIINFNYDRVVEHFIYWSLQLQFKVSAEVAAKAVAGLTVIRPYGSLGKLNWQDQKGGIAYGEDEVVVDLFSVAKGIRTYTEQLEGTKIRDEISDRFESAEFVIFLGFGFHRQNANLLTPKDGHQRLHIRGILATVKEMNPHNHEPIIGDISNTMGLRQRALLLDTTSASLLSNLRHIILMAVG